MADASGYKLIVEDDEGQRNVIPVELGEVSIGRIEDNTIRLDERNISRRHARILSDDGSIFAEDLDSYNGVWINGDRVQGRREIRQGDRIQIGDFSLELKGESLAKSREEVTQKTSMQPAEAESQPQPQKQEPTVTETTQPEIYVDDDGNLANMETPPPAAQPSQSQQPQKTPPPAASNASAAKPAPQPSPAPEPEEQEAKAEPTAIIRMDQLAELHASAEDSGQTLADERGKLVCVSTQLAGSEYEINKTQVVIGRTDENDIAIDHRSVSRHHCKINVKDSRYYLVDMGSANGTLVNGEQYAQTELRSGDLVEIGHVKLRFVPPGESYTYTPEEREAVRQPPPPEAGQESTVPVSGGGPVGRSQVTLIAAAAGGVALALVLAVVLFMGGDEGQKQAAVQVPEQDTGQKAQAPVVPETNEVGKLIGKARDALKARRWKQASVLASAVLELEPGHAEAADIADEAEREQSAQDDYEAANEAIQKGEWADALDSLEDIPESSSYADKGATLVEEATGALINEHLRDAEDALKNKQWGKAEELADAVAELDPEHPEIDTIRQAAAEGRDAQREAEREARERARRARKARRSRRSASQSQAKASGPSAGDLYQRGKQAIKSGDHAKAIRIFNKCVKKDRSFGLCYRALGIAYAHSGNGDKAADNYAKYLKVMPNAPDAAQVKQLLKQYRGN